MARSVPAFAVLAAALVLLPGCSWLLGSAGGSMSESAPASEEERATMYVLAALPALEAYYVDNGTYAGASADALRTSYDRAVPDVEIPFADATTYCIQSTVGGATARKPGPAAEIEPGVC